MIKTLKEITRVITIATGVVIAIIELSNALRILRRKIREAKSNSEGESPSGRRAEGC